MVYKSGEGIFARRYISGRQVLDEALIDGCLVTRYRNCTGQVFPETHLTADRIRYIKSKCPGYNSFELSVDGRDLAGGWNCAGFVDCGDIYGKGRVYKLILEHDAGIKVSVYTMLNGSDFIVRWLEITNKKEMPVSLTAVKPFAGYIWMGSTAASYKIAYNHLKDWGGEGDFCFDDLGEKAFAFYSDYGKSGWSRPACWLRNDRNGETFVCEYAWSGNWRMNARAGTGEFSYLSFDIGMPEIEGEVLRVLEPSETVESPRVHFGLFHDSDDRIVQLTHDYVRRFILPPLPEGVPPGEIEANHRGYLCDRENEEDIKKDIDVAHEIECEMYVVDAGWYGSDYPNQWWNNAGDWIAGPWMKNGFEPIPEYAHKKGMRFGLWVEIEAAGANSVLRREHENWLSRRHGELCAGGRSLDLADPEVEKFCADTISRLIGQYKLDMFRIDHNHNIGQGATRIYCGYCENTLWRYYEAFYRIFDCVRKKHPLTVFQNCAGGGGRLDWGILAHFHNSELSDWMRQPRSTRIFGGITMSLPPEILLRTFGTEVGEWQMDGDIDAQFRICMICRPIYRGIAPSVEELTPYLKERALRYNRLYKSFLRPLMENCLLYHHTPFQPVLKDVPLTVFEYASPDRSRAMVIAFTQSGDGHDNIRIIPRGLSREKYYEVCFDNSGEKVIMSGINLTADGICFNIGVNMSSELVMFREVM
jgi:alpha-galactosidase